MPSCSFPPARPSTPSARPRTVDVATHQDLHPHLSMSRRQESAHAMVQLAQGEWDSRRDAPYGSRGVRMPERAIGGDAVPDERLELLHSRKPAALLAQPDDLATDPHPETPAA